MLNFKYANFYCYVFRIHIVLFYLFDILPYIPISMPTINYSKSFYLYV